MIYAGTRKEWRDWLRENHTRENKVYLIKYKRHTGRPTLTNKESMEEAICFGWIDTIVKRLDDERYQQCFVRRTDKSRWSKNTRGYAKELIKKRKMTSAGLKRYKEGLLKPTIDLNILQNSPADDLQKALQEKQGAWSKFKELAPSYQKIYIHWVERAKRPETRQKRIEEDKIKNISTI